MIKLLIAFALGTIFGVVIMCCFIVAGDEDRRLEKLNKDNNDTDNQYLSKFAKILTNRFL